MAHTQYLRLVNVGAQDLRHEGDRRAILASRASVAQELRVTSARVSPKEDMSYKEDSIHHAAREA